ncbi:hypothetical protein E4U54_008233 [Claviceps lovelessii]|nr:hypothetical protein E4U54_008233 [Claviceps lovelessii]
MQSAVDNPPYALQDVPGKGKGLVATRDIPKGTRIVSEQALITTSAVGDSMESLQRTVFQKVEALDNDQRLAFQSLRNIHPFQNAAEQYVGIFRTNGLPAEDVGDEAAIFAATVRHLLDSRHSGTTPDDVNKLPCSIHPVST